MLSQSVDPRFSVLLEPLIGHNYVTTVASGTEVCTWPTRQLQRVLTSHNIAIIHLTEADQHCFSVSTQHSVVYHEANATRLQ